MNVRELAVSLGLDVDHSGFAEAEGLIHKLTSGFMGAVAAIGAVALGIAEVTRETAEHGKEVLESAERIGVATDKLQELQYAARMSGIGDGQLEFALRNIGRAARAAAAGGGQAAFVFQRMGVTVQELRSLRPDQVLEKLSTAFSKLPSGFEKSNAALSLFGRNGSAMIPFLNKLGEEGKQLFADALASGNVLTEAQLKAADAFINAQRRFNEVMRGLRNALGTPFLSALTGVINQFARWVSEHRKIIVSGMVKFVQILTTVFVGLWHAVEFVVRLFKSFGAEAKAIITGMGILKLAMMAPWMAFLVVLGLVADDFRAFVTGHRSLIGVMLLAGRTLANAWKQSFADMFKPLTDAWTTIKKNWDEFKAAPLTFLLTQVDALFAHFQAVLDKYMPNGFWQWVLGNNTKETERKSSHGGRQTDDELTPKPSAWGTARAIGESYVLLKILDIKEMAGLPGRLMDALNSSTTTGGVPFAGANASMARGGGRSRRQHRLGQPRHAR